MNIIELLRKDHQTVSNLVSELEAADFAEQRTLFPKLEQEIVAHSKAEERTFYAVLASEQEMISHARKEHKTISTLLGAVKGSLGRPQFTEYVGKLKNALEHHVQEEESEMFSRAQDKFPSEELDKLGDKFLELKSSLASM